MGDDEVGNVVDGDDVGFVRFATLFARHLNVKRPLGSAAHDIDLLAVVVAMAAFGLHQNLFDFRRHRAQVRAEELRRRLLQELFGKRVDDGDLSIAPDTDHRRSHA
ncbi:hypothetical protein D9M68_759020 [compost metagenome]